MDLGSGLGAGITLLNELFNHKVFTEGFSAFAAFAAGHPLALAVDFLLVLITLAPAFFFRRRVFYLTMIASIWVVGGGVNGFILLNRMTPFTTADLTVLNTGLDTLPNYLSTKYIVLLFAAVLLLLLALAALLWKGRKTANPCAGGCFPELWPRLLPSRCWPEAGSGHFARATCPMCFTTLPAPMTSMASPTAFCRPG